MQYLHSVSPQAGIQCSFIVLYLSDAESNSSPWTPGMCVWTMSAGDWIARLCTSVASPLCNTSNTRYGVCVRASVYNIHALNDPLALNFLYANYTLIINTKTTFVCLRTSFMPVAIV